MQVNKQLPSVLTVENLPEFISAANYVPSIAQK